MSEPEFTGRSAIGVTVDDQRAVMGPDIAAALVGAGLRADRSSDRADLEVLRCAHRLEIAGLRTSRPGRAASSTAHAGRKRCLSAEVCAGWHRLSATWRVQGLAGLPYLRSGPCPASYGVVR